MPLADSITKCRLRWCKLPPRSCSQRRPRRPTPLLHFYCCQFLFSNSIAPCCTRYRASYYTLQVRMSNTEISTPGTVERGSGSMVLKKNGVRGPPSPPHCSLASTHPQVPTVHTTPIACHLSACVTFFSNPKPSILPKLPPVFQSSCMV